MRKRYLLGSYRLFFGLLTLAAVIVQLSHQIPHGSQTVTNFFSFFTIQSNVLAVGLFLVSGIATLRGRGTERLNFIRGGVTLYMLITGIVYALLLSGLQRELQTTIPWVNTVVHYLMPVVILFDWIIAPARAISFKKALLWLVFPFAYLGYSLIRGYFINWYPYPFLNVHQHGYLRVVATCVVITLAATGLVSLLTWYTRRAR